jgi:hypothetical protein
VYQQKADSESILAEHKGILRDLEHKIQLLVEENEKLNHIIQTQIKRQDFSVVAELERKMQLLISENDKLTRHVEEYRREFGDKLAHAISAYK